MAVGKPLLALASAVIGGGVCYYAENQETEEFLQKLERYVQTAEQRIASQEAELRELRVENFNHKRARRLQLEEALLARGGIRAALRMRLQRLRRLRLLLLKHFEERLLPARFLLP